MGWLTISRKPTAPPSCPLDLVSEAQKLEEALKAASLIMNDDIDGAAEGLKHGDSSFHKLAKGVVAFVRAILGFEKDVIKEASDLLALAEKSAATDHKKMKDWLDACDAAGIQPPRPDKQRGSGSGSDGEEGIYRPDTIYLLCQSMAQLMSALIGVLNETLKESAIAFYKLNRAYGNLERIMQMEEKVVRERRAKVRGGSGSGKKGGSTVGASAATSRTSLQNGEGTTFKKPSPTDDLASSMSTASLNNNSTDDGVRSSTDHRLKIDPDSDLFKNVVDVFVHSGANLCFGALMLFLSMVPPTFATLLSIVGFRGDRERGLHMLWQASRFDNLLGAIGGLALLGFYNGFVRVTDVIPDLSGNAERDVSTYPVGRLHALLEEMCTRFPKSQLWLLEKSRMQAYDKRLDRALEMLNTGEVSPLKQVEALHTFELSLDAMFAHEYALCAESFIKCVDLNSWSQALYIYIAASCHVVLYRKATTPTARDAHATKAEDLLKQVHVYVGKKKFLASQLPFDGYVQRKVNKFQDRARRMGVRLVDAVGVDPVEEMIFLWNGQVRMSEAQIEDSLRNLEWSDTRHAQRDTTASSSKDKNSGSSSAPSSRPSSRPPSRPSSPAVLPTPNQECQDERALLAIIRAGLYREQRRHEEAKRLLRREILDVPEPVKDPYREDWVRPIAYYEVAANAWMQRAEYRPLCQYFDAEGGVRDAGRVVRDVEVGKQVTGVEKGKGQGQGKGVVEHDRKCVAECKENIEKVARWHTYELHARFGMKVTMAQSTVQRWEAEHPVA